MKLTKTDAVHPSKLDWIRILEDVNNWMNNMPQNSIVFIEFTSTCLYASPQVFSSFIHKKSSVFSQTSFRAIHGAWRTQRHLNGEQVVVYENDLYMLHGISTLNEWWDLIHFTMAFTRLKWRSLGIIMNE